jgi:hypothetical protein
MVWEIPLVAHHKQRRVLWMMKMLGWTWKSAGSQLDHTQMMTW